jgi:hypothetical protein
MAVDQCPICRAVIPEGVCFKCQGRDPETPALPGDPPSHHETGNTVSEKPRHSVFSALGFTAVAWVLMMVACLAISAPELAGRLTFYMMIGGAWFCVWALLSRDSWTTRDFLWRFATCMLTVFVLASSCNQRPSQQPRSVPPRNSRG